MGWVTEWKWADLKIKDCLEGRLYILPQTLISRLKSGDFILGKVYHVKLKAGFYNQEQHSFLSDGKLFIKWDCRWFRNKWRNQVSRATWIFSSLVSHSRTPTVLREMVKLEGRFLYNQVSRRFNSKDELVKCFPVSPLVSPSNSSFLYTVTKGVYGISP